jgi:prepilin-type N-terminal cleavage/methylation domain-containing protein
MSVSESAVNRTGFTLLEMLLTSGIALLLMAGLYVAMEVNLNYAAAGREVVDQAELARALLAHITADIQGALTPITATKSTSAAPGTVIGEDLPVSLSTVTPLNMGVVGDSTRLTLYVSRIPKWTVTVANSDQEGAIVSDLRRITYWLSQAGDGGLAKQDTVRVTADFDSDPLPPGVPNEERHIMASEVVGMAFRYFDGTGWTDVWDGALIGDDGLTPVGPPRAIEVRLDIRKPGASPDAENVIRSYRHVVAIGAANAQPAPTTDTTPVTTDPTTGGGP